MVSVDHGGVVTRPNTALATDLVLLAVALVWGSSYLAAKDVSAVTPVVVVLTLRYAISSVVLVPLAAARRGRGACAFRSGLVLGCTQACVLTLETFGVAHTTATNAGLIISLTVVLTPVLSSAWSRTWLPGPFFVAAALAVVGVGLLVSGNGFRAPTWGDGLMLAAAVVRAVHVTLIGELTRQRRIDTLALTAIQSVVGTVVLGAVALPELAQELGSLSVGSWARLSYLALICSVFAFVAQTWAVRRTSASRASLLMGTEPVWALLVGVGIGGERLTTLAATGAAMIVVATYAGQRIERRHSRETDESRTGGGSEARDDEEVEMPCYVTIGYGDEAGYQATDPQIRDAAHDHDSSLVAGGALMGTVGVPVQVRNHDGAGTETTPGAYLTSALPVAGIAVIEADSLEDAIAKVALSPCAVAQGVVEVWPLQE